MYRCCMPMVLRTPWRAQAKAKVEEAIELGGNPDERLQGAVAAGLSEARQRVLQEPASAAGTPGPDSREAAASQPEHKPEPVEGREGQQEGAGEQREGVPSPSSVEQEQRLVPSSSSKDR